MQLLADPLLVQIWKYIKIYRCMDDLRILPQHSTPPLSQSPPQVDACQFHCDTTPSASNTAITTQHRLVNSLYVTENQHNTNGLHVAKVIYHHFPVFLLSPGI